MNKTRLDHFPSITKLTLLALLLVLLTLMFIPSPVSAGPYYPPASSTTTTERGASSCTFKYVGDNAETCSGYAGFPCTCTIICPTCFQEDETCMGISVVVINNICGNSGWREADRFVNWRYYTVKKIIPIR